MENGDTGTVKRGRGRPKGSKSKQYKVTDKVLAQRRDASAKNDLKKLIQTPEGLDYNTRLINHIMQISEIGATADRNDINSLKSCFINYLKLCQTNGFPVQNLAAYTAMGFYDYHHFDVYSKKDDPEKRAFAASVRAVCAMFRESMITDNKLNPVIGIFWQRNFDGLRNDTEQVQSAQEQEEEENNKSYKDKYRKMIGGE